MIAKLYKSNFAKNILLLATGSFAAQVVNLLFAPLLTRLYGPEVFGVLGVFVAVLAILAPIAALTYPYAVILPKSNYRALSLVYLSLYISLIVSILFGLIFMAGGESLLEVIGSVSIAPYILLVPVALFFIALLQLSQQWMLRKRAFKLTAKISIYQSVVSNFFKAFFGFISPSAGVLIVITILGSAFYALLSIVGLRGANKKLSNAKSLIKAPDMFSCLHVARQYKDFPIYRAPQSLISAISIGLPLLLLSKFSGTESAGFYSIANMALVLPAIALGNVVTDVFYKRVSDAKSNNEKIIVLIIKATSGLAILGFLPLAMVVTFGPAIFKILFGSTWGMAGEYARWIAIMSYFGFVNKAAVASIPLLNMYSSLLKFEIVSTSLKICGLLLGFFVFESDLVAIASFSIMAALAHVFLLISVILVAYKN